MTGRRGLLLLVAGLALTLLAGRWLAALYGDWAFYHALGADAVWSEQLMLGALLRIGTFVITFGFAFANFFAVRQSIVSLVLPRTVGGVEFSEAIPTRRLTLLAVGVALTLAALFAVTEQDWTLIAQAMHGLPFREFDPYLDRDLGFYVNVLPFERDLFDLASVLVTTTSILVVAAYVVTPSVRWDERGLYVSTWVRRHLGLLGAVGIVLISWSWRLERFSLLSEGSGASRFAQEARPFSYYDHHTLMPYLVVLAFAALPVAVVFAAAVWRGSLRLAIGLLTALFAAGPLARVVLPSTSLSDTGSREAEARRRPYEATRMLYTRRAFGVDQVTSPDTLPLERLTEAQMGRWVSSWDPVALTRFLERERRGTDVVALSWMPGVVGLEAQLLRRAPSDAPPGTRWPADRLRADASDAAGLPQPGIVPGAMGIGGVLVYPGAQRYALVADTLGGIAAPSFEGGLEKLALAWDEQNPRLLVADAPLPRPRLVTERDALQRLARLVPFLAQGETVTPVVRGDSLYWVVELFVIGEHYPLSERLLVATRQVHYVQHAATAVIQAQSGAITLLPVVMPDPVMRGWMRRFPGIFTPRERAPRWMATGLPPAVDWAMVQSSMLGRTGAFIDTLPVGKPQKMDNADADLTIGGPTLFQLDSLGTLAWSIPLGSPDRLAGLLVARGGLAPRTTVIGPGSDVAWMVVLQDLQEGADRAGIGRSSADSRRGRVQAIPSVRGPIFVQSFYEWPADGAPRLAGVVALRGTERRVGRTLADALGQASTDVGRELPTEAFRAQVAQLYDAMGAALRAGDWKAYGEASAALGRLLGRPAH